VIFNMYPRRRSVILADRNIATRKYRDAILQIGVWVVYDEDPMDKLFAAPLAIIPTSTA
jgi:hypothetical protein